MSMFFNWKTVIPVWTGVVLGLCMLIGPPLTMGTGSFIAFMLVVPLTILLTLGRAPAPTLAQTIAAELRPNIRPRDR